MEGAFDEARSHADRDRSILQDLGLEASVAGMQAFRGIIELLADHPRGAEAALRPALRRLRELPNTTYIQYVASVLAQALVAQGKWDAAREACEIAEESRQRDVGVAVRVRGVRARLAAHENDEVRAARLARSAVEIADTTDQLNDRGDARMDRAVALEIFGRVREAASAAREALALYERKGNVVSSGKARSFVERLTR
jgi:tetratricopeptide (TPR) repeat protein